MINLWRFHKSRSSFGLHAKNGTKMIQTDTLWHAIWPFPKSRMMNHERIWVRLIPILKIFGLLTPKLQKIKIVKTFDVFLIIKSNFIAYMGVLDNAIQNYFCPYFSVYKEFHPVNLSKSCPCLINQQWEAEVSHKEKLVWK